jgi:hypothetical protein
VNHSSDALAEVGNLVAQLRPTQLPVYGALRDFGPQTDEQVQDRLALPANKVAPRRKELVRLGLVEHVGTGTTSTGRRAKLWAIVPPDRVAEARAAAAEERARRKTILDAPLEEQVLAVQLLLKNERVNAAIMSLQGRAGERARARARGARSAAERERRDLKIQIEEAERERSALLHFLKLKRNVKDTEGMMRAVVEFIDADLKRQREYGEPLIPPSQWPEVRELLSGVIDITSDARERLDVATGASDEDVIDVEAVEILELEMPDFEASGGTD